MSNLKKNKWDNYDEVMEYVEEIDSGKKIACKELKLAIKRFKEDIKNQEYELKPRDAEFCIHIIENTFCHMKGEKLDGTPLRGTPFLLEPFHKFIIYNLVGFYKTGTNERRFKEAFIFIPRKNIKTSFAAALAWALGLLNRRSGSTIYITSAALNQSLQSFKFIKWNLENMGEDENFRIIDNNQEHSIQREFEDGSMYVQALAASVDKQDSLNCNMAIADEIHAYKTPKQYNILKEAMKAYTNKLMIGITTAGDNMNSFCYRRLIYCKKVLNKTIKDEQLFIFVCKADEMDSGDIDYTNPIIHEMANPAYGVSIRPEEILNDSLQALNDPQQRKDFFAKSLNIYTAAMKAYFNIEEFRKSDEQFNWSLEELARMPIEWFGGSDLSKLFDLTSGCLYGTLHNYECRNSRGVKGCYDVDIIIPHCWFPIVSAHEKADEDGIPLFGWQDDGWLDMSNDAVVNHAEIINWYIKMKKDGFKIKEIGHDKKFCREYFVGMTKAGFKIVDQPQYFYKKSQGFRHIEKKAKNGLLYFCHADPFDYCVQNVKAIEKTDDMVQYEKIGEKERIDVFDAAVFACVRMLEHMETKGGNINKWFGRKDKKE